MFINKKQIILFSVIIAMIAGFFFLQYLPTMARIKEAKEMETQRQALQAKVDSDLQKLPDLMEKLEDLKANVGDFDKRIPVERDYGIFLQFSASILEILQSLWEWQRQWRSLFQVRCTDCIAVW